MRALKYLLLPLRSKNNSGIILLVVLWILSLLTVLAVSLGRGTHVELTLAKYFVGKMQSKYAAWAGLMWAVNEIRKDTEDAASNDNDTLYYCAIPQNQQSSMEELFKDKTLGDASFNVEYREIVGTVSDERTVFTTTVGPTHKKNVNVIANSTETSDRNKERHEYKTHYGLRDEERKLNINALTSQNISILDYLLESLGIDKDTALTIGFSIIDWIDQDDELGDSVYGAENDYYLSLDKSYKCKNLPFDSLEELLLVKGMTPAIFSQIKDYLTVFPKAGALQLNFNTALSKNLKALAQSLTGPESNADSSDADAVVSKLLEYRAGDDRVEFTSDDRSIDSNEIAFNEKEKALFLRMNQYAGKSSNFIRVSVRGTDSISAVATRIEAVVQREDLSIVFWNRQ